MSIVEAASYRAGDRFSFNLDCPQGVDAPVSVEWYLDDEPAGAESVILTAGIHTIDARLTFSDGSQGILSLEIDVTP